MPEIQESSLLLVDDRPENLLALENILQNLECRLFKATSGQEALRLIKKHDFALVLLDVQMPDMDGFETAALMRGIEKARQIPIIFVTALSDEQNYVFRGYETGAVDYLFKPINPEILRSKVQVFLDLHKKAALLKWQTQELEQHARALEQEISRRQQLEAELRRHQDHLELLVQERTIELSAANTQMQQEIVERRQVEEALRESETRYRSLFDGVPIGLYRTTPNGQILDANAAFVQLFGYPNREELSAHKSLELYADPMDRVRWQMLIGQQDVVRNFEVRFRRLDGTIFWGKNTGCSLRDKRGLVAMYEGSLEDITERKRAEEQLVELKHAMETLPIGVTITDLDGIIRYTNPAEAAMHGYDAEELAGQDVGIFAPPECRQPITLEQLADWRGLKRESVNLRNDGSSFPVWLMSELIRAPQGEPFAIVTSCEDITERKRAEQELSLYRDHLEEVVKERTAELIDERKALNQRNHELLLLNQIGQMLNSTLDVDRVLASMLRSICQLLNITAASFWLRASDTEELVCRQAIGAENSTLHGWRLAPGQGIIGQSAQQGTPLIVADTRTEAQHHKCVDQAIGVEQRSLLSFPFRIKGEVIGVLCLVDTAPNRFTPEQLRVVEPLAAVAAGAVENARLYAVAQKEIAERTQAEANLLTAHRDLKATVDHLQQTQSQLIQSEKMAALGKLIANVAHEINTPLGAIRASAGNILTALDATFLHLPEVVRQLSPDQEAAFLALITSACHPKQVITSKEERQRRRAMQRLLEDASIAQADTIADTLVDMGIYGEVASFLPVFQHEQATRILGAAANIAVQRHNSDNILFAVERMSKIIFALKSYAHTDASGEATSARVTDGLDVVLTLYYNQLKQGIDVVKHYADTPPIRCYPDELNQVWTNLIHNAIQAMQGKGRLEIAVAQHQPTPNPSQEGNSRIAQSQEGNSSVASSSSIPLLGGVGGGSWVVVEITDSGPGIPDAIKGRIFEPFFTTKPAGEGSGLGLDICQKILEKHQGNIEFESQPGRTTFRVWLPVS